MKNKERVPNNGAKTGEVIDAAKMGDANVEQKGDAAAKN